MTDFLYPFLERDERDADSLLADLARSADEKRTASASLRRATLVERAADLAAAAEAMAGRFRRGGRLFTFGNGGSATDADGAAALFGHPPHGRGLPARSLAADPALVTALANDVGVELVFSRQLMAAAGPDDIALGLSTSGSSTNLLRAFGEARSLGMLTVGVAGYDGGTMGSGGAVDHCLVVGSDSVHRIQETQAALVLDLWERVQALVGDGPISPIGPRVSTDPTASTESTDPAEPADRDGR